MRPYLQLFLFLVAAVPLLHAQQRPFATTIRGESISLPDNTEVLMILYSSAHCHQCMQQLSDYALRWQQKKPQRQVYILIPGDNTIALRSEAMAVAELFQSGKCPSIVYDRVPEAVQYTTLYNITRFPCAIMWQNETACTYYSYDKMFGKHRNRFPE